MQWPSKVKMVRKWTLFLSLISVACFTGTPLTSAAPLSSSITSGKLLKTVFCPKPNLQSVSTGSLIEEFIQELIQDLESIKTKLTHELENIVSDVINELKKIVKEIENSADELVCSIECDGCKAIVKLAQHAKESFWSEIITIVQRIICKYVAKDVQNIDFNVCISIIKEFEVS